MRFFLALLLCALGVSAADAPRRAPGFALPDSKMEVHDLYDYRGKPVILEFMQTTCPHCASFVPVLQKIQQKYGDKVQILAVTEPPDTLSTVAQFVEGHKITYPVLFDMGQAAYSYVRQGHVVFPQIYIIDPKGMIYAHFEYTVLDRDIFEGNGLMNEIDRMMTKK
jgi:peroxiredoxin